MRGSKGYYAGTRSLLKKPTREKGKPKIRKLLQELRAWVPSDNQDGF